jgi:hypothetical protein
MLLGLAAHERTERITPYPTPYPTMVSVFLVLNTTLSTGFLAAASTVTADVLLILIVAK